MKYFFCFICLHVGCLSFSQGLVEKKNLVYGNGPDWHNRVVDLKLDLLYPASGRKLPLIVFVHGGSFMENFTKDGPAPFCERLAKNGFVVANVEYRTGVNLSSDSFRTSATKAVYRAEQDQKAAVRYLVHHARNYPIDTSQVFLAGESAGGVTSLFSAYVSQADWDHLVPSLHSLLGTVDSSGNDLDAPFRIKGVINLWGGIADTALISKSEAQAIPVLLFHSQDDAEVPFERVSHPQAKNQLLHGSRDIANRFKNNNGCYQLYFTKGAEHAYGFSSDYLTNAISKFVADVLEGKCSSTEIENKGNLNLGLLDADSDTLNVLDKTITVSPEVLQQYAGQYEWNGQVITISVDGDHLKFKAPGEEAHELYPVKADVFVEKKLHIQTTFIRNAQGNVIDLEVLRTKNRQDRYKKIK